MRMYSFPYWYREWKSRNRRPGLKGIPLTLHQGRLSPHIAHISLLGFAAQSFITQCSYLSPHSGNSIPKSAPLATLPSSSPSPSVPPYWSSLPTPRLPLAAAWNQKSPCPHAKNGRDCVGVGVGGNSQFLGPKTVLPAPKLTEVQMTVGFANRDVR